MKNKIIFYQDIGLMNFDDVFLYQTSLFEHLKTIKIGNKNKKISDKTDNYFIFTEHPNVYTLGKSGKLEHLLINEQQLLEKSVSFVKTNRGGDITYHGPGQIVGYPIIDLDNFGLDIISYMRNLEEVIIRFLKNYNIKGERSKGETGVWLDVGKPSMRKICAMGVKTSRWITMHGFAINVDTNLSYFNYIIPCGIKNKGVTSIKNELGISPDKQLVKNQIIEEFEFVFGSKFIKQSLF